MGLPKLMVHKAFQSPRVSQKNQQWIQRSGIKVWWCDLGKTLRLVELLCHYLLAEVVIWFYLPYRVVQGTMPSYRCRGFGAVSGHGCWDQLRHFGCALHLSVPLYSGSDHRRMVGIKCVNVYELLRPVLGAHVCAHTPLLDIPKLWHTLDVLRESCNIVIIPGSEESRWKVKLK